MQPQKVLNYVLKHTPLRTTFGVLMLALVDGAPTAVVDALMAPLAPEVQRDFDEHAIEGH